jgi:hypothetical protein
LTKNSIDSWAKCKDAFIGRYYPPAKIISLRSNIIKFTQFDNEHVAQARERKKLLFDSILRANYELDASSLDIT